MSSVSQARPADLPPALLWPEWTDEFRWEPTDDDAPADVEAASTPSDEDAAWWAANSPANVEMVLPIAGGSPDADDEDWDRLAELAAAVARLERGLDGCDLNGGFGHPA